MLENESGIGENDLKNVINKIMDSMTVKVLEDMKEEMCGAMHEAIEWDLIQTEEDLLTFIEMFFDGVVIAWKEAWEETNGRTD